MDELTLKQAREVFAQVNRDPANRQEGALCFAFTIYYEGDVLSNAEGIRRFGIHAANWLTWVGDRWLERLGGREALKSAAQPPLVVHSLPSVVVVQAGDAPALGDTNRGERLEAYHAAGQLLKPVRLPLEKLGKYGPIGGIDNTRSWLQRFD